MEGTPELPGKANVGGVLLKKVLDGKTPEHYAWKKKLEREWAGDWGTLAKLTKYRYKIGLDPAFAVERPEFKKGELHWYEWILCGNGGFIYLYDDVAKIFTLSTTTQTGQKVLDGVTEASLSLEFDERLSREIRFPLSVLRQVCELAGARRARQPKTLTPEEKKILTERVQGYRFKVSGPGIESPEIAEI